MKRSLCRVLRVSAAAAVLTAVAVALTACGNTPQASVAVQTPTPGETTEEMTVSVELVTPTPTPSPTPTPTPTPTPAPTPVGIWGGDQPEKFTDGEVITTEDTYRSEKAYVQVTTVSENTVFYYEDDKEPYELVYFVADIYVQDATEIQLFRSSNEGEDTLEEMANSVHAAVALTGDFCQTRTKGLIIRNGEVIRTKLDPERDVCVLFRDGSMKVYLAGRVPVDEIVAADPWQSWCFGPVLVQDGVAQTKFNLVFEGNNIGGRNPRAAIGYYEPGHYCFVQVDGRQDGYSWGLSVTNLAILMQNLGCQTAYNLDGGATAQMAFLGKTISKQSKDRNPRDFAYIAFASETAEDGAGQTPEATADSTLLSPDGETASPDAPTPDAEG